MRCSLFTECARQLFYTLLCKQEIILLLTSKSLVLSSFTFQALLVRRVVEEQARRAHSLRSKHDKHDVLASQPCSSTAAPPTTQAVSAQKSHKERQVQGKGVKTPAFKLSGKLLGLGWR
jgi:hypothetical protein